MSGKGRVVVAGGTGFVGRAIVRELLDQRYEPVVLSRSGHAKIGIPKIEKWDASAPESTVSLLDGTLAVINLCGSPINVRWTPRNRADIIDSRVLPTQGIGRAIRACAEPPKVWVNMSAVGYYGNTGTRTISEASGPGDGFVADVCVKWEAAFEEIALPLTRKVKIRAGVALGLGGGAFPELLHLVKMFLGGTVGSGEQFISWVHLRDLARMFVFAIENPEITGALNGTAPHPVNNASFMALLRKAAHRPWAPPAPAALVAMVARLKGTEPELLFEGQKAVPQIALGHGFKFLHPTLSDALKSLIGPLH